QRCRRLIEALYLLCRRSSEAFGLREFKIGSLPSGRTQDTDDDGSRVGRAYGYPFTPRPPVLPSAVISDQGVDVFRQRRRSSLGIASTQAQWPARQSPDTG